MNDGMYTPLGSYQTHSSWSRGGVLPQMILEIWIVIVVLFYVYSVSDRGYGTPAAHFWLPRPSHYGIWRMGHKRLHRSRGYATSYQQLRLHAHSNIVLKQALLQFINHLHCGCVSYLEARI